MEVTPNRVGKKCHMTWSRVASRGYMRGTNVEHGCVPSWACGYMGTLGASQHWLAAPFSFAPLGVLLLLYFPACCKMSPNVFTGLSGQQSSCVFSLQCNIID